VTIYSIATKFGIRICPYPTFQCTEFQGNRIMLLCFMTIFTLWQKEGRNSPNFRRFIYLRKTLHDLVENWNVRWWHWPTFPLQKSFSFIKVSQSYVYVKIALLFFLLITHGCGVVWYAGFLGRTTHYCVSWWQVGHNICPTYLLNLTYFILKYLQRLFSNIVYEIAISKYSHAIYSYRTTAP